MRPRDLVLSTAVATALAAVASMLGSSPAAADQAGPHDGSIVYNDDTEGPARDGIWIMDADGTDARRLVRGDAYRPRVSPDGTQMLFQYHQTIRVRDLEGEGRGTRVSPKRKEVSGGSWSPDGRQVAYVQRTHDLFLGEMGRILVTDLVTGVTTRVADVPERSETAPVWSPDGTSIVFAAWGDRGCRFFGDLVDYFYDLRRIDLDSGVETRIKIPGADISVTPVDWHDDTIMVSAGWFEGASGDPEDECPETGWRSGAYTMDADGSHRVERPRAGWFSPDGKWITYDVGGMVVESLWVSRVDGTEARLVREVAETPDWTAFERG